MNTNTHLNAGARGAGRISRYLPQRDENCQFYQWGWCHP